MTVAQQGCQVWTVLLTALFSGFPGEHLRPSPLAFSFLVPCFSHIACGQFGRRASFTYKIRFKLANRQRDWTRRRAMTTYSQGILRKTNDNRAQ